MRRCGSVMLVAVLFSAAGCGGPEGPVMGTVEGTLKIGGAAPAEPMRIEFFSATSGQGTGADVAKDGTFELEEPVPVGDYKVFFTPPPAPEPTGNAPPAPFKPLNSVPTEFTNDTASPLTKKVAEGANTIDVEAPKK